ncbi:pfs domain-containing protein [Colletotrichum incanum]|uniref:Pfs domain-containing protein n=1 Tax=Colletotrichum incanum TaxID=1573173 RepID=A0A161WLZ5_COLIC|nr:pfs domain-containing protein [Colletotrichum incanum]
MQSEARPPGTHEEYTIAIVCAMSFELSAVRYMLDQEHPRLPTKDGDSNIYVLGELSGHNVVLACLPGQQGKGAAATVATNIARTFPGIKWRFLVGIAGGIPSNKHDIRLGDVVVSMPEGQFGGVVQYDLGKDTDAGFLLKGSLWPPPSLLRSAVEMMRSDHLVGDNKIEGFVTKMLQKGPRLAAYQRPSDESDVLFHEGYTHDADSASCASCDRSKVVRRRPRQPEGSVIHYGLITSGDSVLKSSSKRSDAVRRLGDVLCFEMEAAGIMSEFSCIVIRGISDYADSHKNDDWHYFAAAAAAACTKELLAYIDPATTPTMSTASTTSLDEASNPRRALIANHSFYGTGIQHSGSGSFSVGNNLNIK